MCTKSKGCLLTLRITPFDTRRRLVSMPAETSLAICSLMLGGVFEKLPDLRVCFAHGGGSFPGTLGRVQHGFDVRPDLVAGTGARTFLRRLTPPVCCLEVLTTAP